MRQCLSVSLLFFFICLPFSAEAATWDIDTAHSAVSFKVRHLGISSVPGSFAKFTGTFEFDPKKIDASKAEAKIEVSSINTANEKRDEHLRAPDFFDVTKFPEMSFVSKRIADINDNQFSAIGDLTMHGVTKEVALRVTYNGSAVDPWGQERAAFSATATIDRSDFGLTWSKVLETGALVVGKDVAITLEIEGTKKK